MSKNRQSRLAKLFSMPWAVSHFAEDVIRLLEAIVSFNNENGTATTTGDALGHGAGSIFLQTVPSIPVFCPAFLSQTHTTSQRHSSAAYSHLPGCCPCGAENTVQRASSSPVCGADHLRSARHRGLSSACDRHAPCTSGRPLILPPSAPLSRASQRLSSRSRWRRSYSACQGCVPALPAADAAAAAASCTASP